MTSLQLSHCLEFEVFCFLEGVCPYLQGFIFKKRKQMTTLQKDFTLACSSVCVSWKLSIVFSNKLISLILAETFWHAVSETGRNKGRHLNFLECKHSQKVNQVIFSKNFEHGDSARKVYLNGLGNIQTVLTSFQESAWKRLKFAFLFEQKFFWNPGIAMKNNKVETQTSVERFGKFSWFYQHYFCLNKMIQFSVTATEGCKRFTLIFLWISKINEILKQC